MSFEYQIVLDECLQLRDYFSVLMARSVLNASVGAIGCKIAEKRVSSAVSKMRILELNFRIHDGKNRGN